MLRKMSLLRMKCRTCPVMLLTQKEARFSPKSRACFQDQLLERLIDRHDQSCCDQVTGDCIRTHLPVDGLHEPVAVG